MRAHLQAGTGRKQLALFCGLACASLLWYLWSEEVGKRVLANGSKIAFVSAAFAVTAYNLRTRVVDLVLKIETSPSHTSTLCEKAGTCGGRLTNLVVLFVLTASLMGCLDFFKGDLWGKLVACVAIFAFVSSCVNFVYVLFAFERLEKFALDDAVERSVRRERDRLSKKIS